MNEKITVDAIQEIKEILDKHNIEFWLSCGTLLGAVRDGKLIPWDWDVDFATWEKNKDQVTKVFDEIKQLGYEVIFSDWQNCVKILKENCEIGIDFYKEDENLAKLPLFINNKIGEKLDYLSWTFKIENPNLKRGKAPPFLTKIFVGISNKLPGFLKNKISKTVEKTHQQLGCNLIHVAVPEEYFKELKTMDFYGINFRVPKDAEGYLKYTYGKDWKTPNKDFVYYEDDFSLIK